MADQFLLMITPFVDRRSEIVGLVERLINLGVTEGRCDYLPFDLRSYINEIEKHCDQMDEIRKLTGLLSSRARKDDDHPMPQFEIMLDRHQFTLFKLMYPRYPGQAPKTVRGFIWSGE